ncbi:MAG TPA: YCF48-related protein [candidate division Zixibacteria bacterium]|nr:YCF48-related protein [candidate division Zixibacteria bacterium]HOZ06821.1 YCF48-related protein [candidate division Zixibacteria bacterium]
MIAGCSDDETTGPGGGGGGAWTLVSPTTEGNLYRGACFVDATTGWLVGVDGRIVKTTDGGTTWIEQASQTNRTLRAVDFVSRQDGWVVGDDGRVRRTEDGGTTWSLPLLAVTDRSLSAVEGVTARRVFAVGEEGILYYSLDAGRRFSAVPLEDAGPLRDIVVFDTSAVAVGDDGFIARFFNYDWEIERLTADTTVDTLPVDPDTLPDDFPADTVIDTTFVPGDTIVDTTYWWPDTLVDTTYFTVDTIWSGFETVTAEVDDNLLGVAYAGGNSLWAVGENGVFLSSDDRGASWEVVDLGVTAHLTSVASDGAGGGIITGLNGTVLVTSDNGATWAAAQSGYALDLYASSSPAADNFWASGDAAVFRSADAGETWEQRVTGTSLLPTLTDIVFVSPDSGFAVGYTGTILRTTDAGQTWVTVRQGSAFAPAEWFSAAAFTDNLHVWAVGRTGLPPYYLLVVRTSDGGESWERFEFPDNPPDPDNPAPDTAWGKNVVFLDDLTGYICAGDSILYTTTGGASWVKQASPDTVTPPRTIHDLSFADATHAWAVGKNGLILQTTDGLTWEIPTDTVKTTLWAVDCFDANGVVAVGNGGEIWRTTDGGTTWSKVSSPTKSTLIDVSFVDAQSGKAVGQNGTVLSTGDGGRTWTVQASPTAETLIGVEMIDRNVGWIVGGHAPDASGVMLRTTTGGN